jgi:sigma-E factor negative regulatory protein RseA
LAVAAGFVAVAGVLVATRVAGPVGAPQTGVFATLQPPAPTVRAVAAVPQPALAAEEVPLGDVRLIRDGQLDRYLAAHKQFGNNSAVSVPGVMLRNAATFAPER